VLIAVFAVLINWLSLWGLTALRRWTVADVLIQFLAAVTQYFTCSTFRVSEARGDETINLPKLYDERRPLIMSAFLALDAIACFQNWWDRNNMAGLRPDDWIGEDLGIVPMAVGAIVAGWARPIWLQWAAAVLMAGLMIFFGLRYALPSG